MSDPAGWDLPPVSDAQIDGWLSDLSRPLPAGATVGEQNKHDMAQRELFDLLPRDEYVPRLKKAIQTRLAQHPSPAAAAQLRIFAELDEAGAGGGNLVRSQEARGKLHDRGRTADDAECARSPFSSAPSTIEWLVA